MVHYWEIQGTPEEALFVHITDSLENIDVPQPGHLDLIDIDTDGDYDLLIGDNAGHIQYFQNIGTPAVFDFELVTSNMSSINVGSKASPCFIDIDADNDYDLFVGESRGGIMFFRNQENPLQAELTISVSGNDVILTWGSIASAVEYQIFYQNIPYFTPEGIPQAIVLPPDTVWTDEGGVNEWKRFYRMITQY